MIKRTDVPFYLVWNEDGDAPRVKHDSEAKAEKEASRLASAFPGKSFTVLAPITRITNRAVEVERFDPFDSIPF